MTIAVAIIPAAGLKIEQHQELGQAIHDSLKAWNASEDGPLVTGMPSSIEDLLAGELPTPMSQRASALYRLVTANFKGLRAIPSPSEAAAYAKEQMRGDALVDLLEVPAVVINLHNPTLENDGAIREMISTRLPSGTVKEVRVIRK